MAVHVAARVATQAEAGEILITRPTMDLCAGSGLAFDPRGPKNLRGVPGMWDLFAAGELPVEGAVGEDSRVLRPGDRAFLATAHRAPGVLRALSRLTRSRR
jgi:class 3 adenylate cyclase